MPKVFADYSNTIIYKLCCNDANIADIYIGHTTNFIQRKHNHKIVCNNPNSKNHNLVVYQRIRECNGWDNWSMIEIEKYSCNDLNEAFKRERYWLEELNDLQSRTNKINQGSNN